MIPLVFMVTAVAGVIVVFLRVVPYTCCVTVWLVSDTDGIVSVEVNNVLVNRLDVVSVLIVRVEYIKLVALIVETVSVDVTYAIWVIVVFPRRVMVLNVVIFIVDAVIVDAEIPFANTVLPIMVEYEMAPIVNVDVVSVEYKSVLP